MHFTTKLFFRSYFQHFISSPQLKSCFSKPKKELPLVALFEQEKLAFQFPGFPLRSGLGNLKYNRNCLLIEDLGFYDFKKFLCFRCFCWFSFASFVLNHRKGIVRLRSRETSKSYGHERDARASAELLFISV